MRKRKERFPALLSIELSSVCNADCIMCPHGSMGRRKQNISMELLEKVLADCQSQPLKKINLFWFGDSLCNKRVIECLRMARRMLPHVKMCLSTNAGLLHEERSKAIIDEDLLDVINFDIDGFTKETYEAVRKKLKFDITLKNVHYFLDYKKKCNKKKPETRVTIINMQPTKHEIDDFVRYWKPLADKVDVNKYNTWLGTQKDLNVGKDKQLDKKECFDFACSHPWDELVISADGYAGLCCLDYDLKAPVGNITEISVKEAWNSKEINAYRDKMLKLDYNSIDVCKNCNAYIYQTDKTWAKLQR